MAGMALNVGLFSGSRKEKQNVFSQKQKDSKLYNKWEMSGMRYPPQRELGLWGLGFRPPSAPDQSWDVGQSLSLA